MAWTCKFCGKLGQSRTINGDWLCADCFRELGGLKAWPKIRKMSSDELTALKKTPIKARVLDNGGGATAIKKGGIGRAAVGGLLFGGFGAVIGAGTGKRNLERNDYTMFKVWFSDGTDAVLKIPHESELYYKCLSVIED